MELAKTVLTETVPQTLQWGERIPQQDRRASDEQDVFPVMSI